MWHPQTVLMRLKKGSLLTDEAFVGVDFDALLDRRDCGEFDQAWSRAAKQVDGTWEGLPANQSLKATIDSVREAAFKRVFQATQGHEISGYVSDDFGLICKAVVAGLNHPLVEHLAESYNNHRIPKKI